MKENRWPHLVQKPSVRPGLARRGRGRPWRRSCCRTASPPAPSGRRAPPTSGPGRALAGSRPGRRRAGRASTTGRSRAASSWSPRPRRSVHETLPVRALPVRVLPVRVLGVATSAEPDGAESDAAEPDGAEPDAAEPDAPAPAGAVGADAVPAGASRPHVSQKPSSSMAPAQPGRGHARRLPGPPSRYLWLGVRPGPLRVRRHSVPVLGGRGRLLPVLQGLLVAVECAGRRGQVAR